MKKALTIAFMLALLVVSFSFMAMADSKSQVQNCVAATGLPADTCATCAAVSHGASDFGPCVCKVMKDLSPDSFDAQFKNMGECVNYVKNL